jgi:hypothetical protein
LDEPQPEPIPEGEFVGAWRRFVGAIKRLLSGVPAARALDPFLPLRDSALEAADSAEVANGLQVAWSSLHEPNRSPRIAHLILTELNAFAAAVEITESERARNTTPSMSNERLLNICQTGLESLRDLLEDLPFPLKALLKVIIELIDIFRGAIGS